MLIPEHEGEDDKDEKVYLAQDQCFMVLESSFFIFSNGKEVFYAAVYLSCLLSFLVSLMHGRKNPFVRKGSYFNKPFNGFILFFLL